MRRRRVLRTDIEIAAVALRGVRGVAAGQVARPLRTRIARRVDRHRPAPTRRLQPLPAHLHRQHAISQRVAHRVAWALIARRVADRRRRHDKARLAVVVGDDQAVAVQPRGQTGAGVQPVTEARGRGRIGQRQRLLQAAAAHDELRIHTRIRALHRRRRAVGDRRSRGVQRQVGEPAIPAPQPDRPGPQLLRERQRPPGRRVGQRPGRLRVDEAVIDRLPGARRVAIVHRRHAHPGQHPAVGQPIGPRALRPHRRHLHRTRRHRARPLRLTRRRRLRRPRRTTHEQQGHESEHGSTANVPAQEQPTDDNQSRAAHRGLPSSSLPARPGPRPRATPPHTARRRNSSRRAYLSSDNVSPKRTDVITLTKRMISGSNRA